MVKTYIADNNIMLFATHSEPKAEIVERLIRTIKGIMFGISQRKTREGILISFMKLFQKYNAFYHRSIKMAPKDVIKDRETKVWINMYEKRLS